MADRDLDPETYVPTSLRPPPPVSSQRLAFTVDLVVAEQEVGGLAGPFYDGLEQALEFAPRAHEARAGEVYITRHDQTGTARVYRWEVPSSGGRTPCWRRLDPQRPQA